MEELFRQLGLNENEREVYLAVLQAGKIAPNQVAKVTSINRTTVYSVAKKLEKMGLVTQDLGQKVNYLVATPLEKLVTVFEREEKMARSAPGRCQGTLLPSALLAKRS